MNEMFAVIQSVGAPPERHADRVVAAMMRQLARESAERMITIAKAIGRSSDGSPRAQQRMTERVRKAGALGTVLEPGKRGKYRLHFFAWSGWNRQTGDFILPGDFIPEHPQLAVHIHRLISDGRGSGQTQFESRPVMFVSHHALSRLAQRCGARTPADLIDALLGFWLEALPLLVDGKAQEIPPQGLRVPVKTAGGGAVVVFQKDKQWDALVAATVLTTNGTDQQ
jgi:hypothetical protein